MSKQYSKINLSDDEEATTSKSNKSIDFENYDNKSKSSILNNKNITTSAVVIAKQDSLLSTLDKIDEDEPSVEKKATAMMNNLKKLEKYIFISKEDMSNYKGTFDVINDAATKSSAKNKYYKELSSAYNVIKLRYVKQAKSDEVWSQEYGYASNKKLLESYQEEWDKFNKGDTSFPDMKTFLEKREMEDKHVVINITKFIDIINNNNLATIVSKLMDNSSSLMYGLFLKQLSFKTIMNPPMIYLGHNIKFISGDDETNWTLRKFIISMPTEMVIDYVRVVHIIAMLSSQHSKSLLKGHMELPYTKYDDSKNVITFDYERYGNFVTKNLKVISNGKDLTNDTVKRIKDNIKKQVDSFTQNVNNEHYEKIKKTVNQFSDNNVIVSNPKSLFAKFINQS